MKACFIQIWKIRGINTIGPDIGMDVLGTARNPSISARLVDDPEPYFFQIDRQKAIAGFSLNFSLGKSDDRSANEKLVDSIEKAKAIRQEEAVKGAFVVFEGTDEIPISQCKKWQETESYSLCVDGFDKTQATQRFRPFVRSVLAAIELNLAANASRDIAKVGEVIFLRENDDDKPTYSIKFGGRAEGTVACPFTRQTFEKVVDHIPKILRNEEISVPVELFTNSLDTSKDDLEAFILAWSGLETFIKTSYRDNFLGNSSSTLDSSNPYEFKRKSLPKAFKELVVILDSNSSDVEDFGALNRTRNAFFHEGKFPERFPIEATQNLLIKYLKLHLNSEK